MQFVREIDLFMSISCQAEIMAIYSSCTASLCTADFPLGPTTIAAVIWPYSLQHVRVLTHGSQAGNGDEEVEHARCEPGKRLRAAHKAHHHR
mmetsp:Transcript_16741/g.23366  ORF Transcript_16741/g.23366 Transcript_16741/m.23366 type:complete len:92 (-) Transcript_16741:322-597(-)